MAVTPTALLQKLTASRTLVIICAVHWPLAACEAWPVGAFTFHIWPMGCALPTSALILVLDHTSQLDLHKQEEDP